MRCQVTSLNDVTYATPPRAQVQGAGPAAWNLYFSVTVTEPRRGGDTRPQEGREERARTYCLTRRQKQRGGTESSRATMALMGRVALVTGGAQGIGRAVVEALLRSAAKVRNFCKVQLEEREAAPAAAAPPPPPPSPPPAPPQVSVVDINQNCGDSCKSELDAEFGGGSCAFIQCDVTDGDALRGERSRPRAASERRSQYRTS